MKTKKQEKAVVYKIKWAVKVMDLWWCELPAEFLYGKVVTPTSTLVTYVHMPGLGRNKLQKAKKLLTAEFVQWGKDRGFKVKP